MEITHKIPQKVTFLKEEGNRCIKRHGCLQGSAYYYLYGIKLLYFSCIVSYADKALFRHLAISLNLNLVISELKQGKFATMTICSLVLDFECSNTKALFKRAKAAWGLQNIHQALTHLKEVAQIESYNYEIAKEIAKIEGESYQVEANRSELKGSKQGSGHAERPCV